MDLKILPSTPHGSISIPPSKSLTHRYIIMASLTDGISVIRNPLLCDDTLYTIEALKNLGIQIIVKNNYIFVEGCSGKIKPKNTNIFLGDSGTSARFFISLCALSEIPIQIDGSKRLRERPNKDLFKTLEDKRIKITYLDNQYCLPAKIEGGLFEGGKISISGKISSQFISSLLMIAPFAQKDTEIIITDKLKSKPYVDLTIQTMNKFGVKVERNGYKSFFIKNKQQYHSGTFVIEGDYSSASYFIALSYLKNAPIVIKNLRKKSGQADEMILEVIKKLGGEIKSVDGGIIVKRQGQIKSAEIDISDCPDIGLTLGIIGPFTKESLTLTGIDRLIGKESDRKEALIVNLKNLGAKVEVGNNFLKIWKSDLKSGVIDSFNDHRVAMSFSILGTMIPNGVVIKNAQVVSKSYPHFFDDLKKIT